MRRILMGAALVLLVGCGGKMKRLSETEQDHFYALKVFMNEDVRKDYLKLKTEAERDEFLKQKNLWDLFYKYDADVRQAIVAGEVKVGWQKEQVFMAWGEPHEKLQLTGRPYTYSVLLTYRFEGHDDGSVLVWTPNSKTAYKATQLFLQQVYVDDDRVTEIVRKDTWD